MNARNLHEHIKDSIERSPSSIAYENLGTKITYQDVYHKALHVASYLASLGLGHGDKIGIMMPNVLQQPIITIACMIQGITVVNINPLYTVRELSHQLKDSETKCIFVLENMAHVVEKSVPDTKVEHIIVCKIGDMFPWFKKHLINAVIKYIKKMVPSYNLPKAKPFLEILNHPIHQYTPYESKLDDIAFLQYTGGTTGPSKGAMLTHENLLSNIKQGEQVLPEGLYEGSTIILTALPLYHIFAMTVSFVTLGQGGTNLLVTNPRDIPKLIDLLKKNKVHGIPILNTLMNALLNHPEFKNINFMYLRATITGGMATSSSTAKKWQEATGCVVQQGYGLSETSPIVSLTKNTLSFAPNVGLPVPDTDVCLLDDKGNLSKDVDEGEICVKGPQVMKGYWNNPEETKKSFTKEGYFKTGDIGKILKSGKIKLIERKKDIIIVSGFNVYPSEVEEVLSQHPDIIEAGVVGIQQKDGNEKVKAFIVSNKPNIDLSSVDKHCHDLLTNYKVPKEFSIVKELPKTNVGKVLRRMLKNPKT